MIKYMKLGAACVDIISAMVGRVFLFPADLTNTTVHTHIYIRTYMYAERNYPIVLELEEREREAGVYMSRILKPEKATLKS